jgi:hypothetical protein
MKISGLIQILTLSICIPILSDSCNSKETPGPNGGGSKFGTSSHLSAQEDMVASNSDLGVPLLNSDNSVSFVTKSNGSYSQSFRVKQDGSPISNTTNISADQEAYLDDLHGLEASNSLSNGYTVRFAVETAEGIQYPNQPEPFYLYAYVNNGIEEIERKQLINVQTLSTGSGSYYGSIWTGVTYYVDDKIVYTYYEQNGTSSAGNIKWKVGFVVLDDQINVLTSAMLSETFEYKVFHGPLRGQSDLNYPIPLALVGNFFPKELSRNTLGGHLIVIPTGDFYYVVGVYDHNPSYRSGNQIILKEDSRTHVMRYEINGTKSWEQTFTSKLPLQNNSKWFFMDRFMLTKSNQLIFSAELDIRGKQALVGVDENGNSNILYVGGYIHSFDELGDGKIGISGWGYYNDRTATAQFTGVLESDLSYENSNLDSYSGFLY